MPALGDIGVHGGERWPARRRAVALTGLGDRRARGRQPVASSVSIAARHGAGLAAAALARSDLLDLEGAARRSRARGRHRPIPRPARGERVVGDARSPAGSITGAGMDLRRTRNLLGLVDPVEIEREPRGSGWAWQRTSTRGFEMTSDSALCAAARILTSPTEHGKLAVRVASTARCDDALGVLVQRTHDSPSDSASRTSLSMSIDGPARSLERAVGPPRPSTEPRFRFGRAGLVRAPSGRT